MMTFTDFSKDIEGVEEFSTVEWHNAPCPKKGIHETHAENF